VTVFEVPLSERMLSPLQGLVVCAKDQPVVEIIWHIRHEYGMYQAQEQMVKSGPRKQIVVATDLRTYCFGSNQYGQCGFVQ